MTSYEWSPPYPAWVYVVLTATLAGLLLAARVLARSPTARRWSFLLLRGSVLALVVGIFLNLVRVTENRQPPRLPEVVFLVDCSRSMALDRPVSRLERIKQILVQKDRAVSGARLSLYRFGSQLAAVTGLNDLSPTDEATRLFDSLERLTAHFGADRPAGVVVFSDGRLTETTDFEEITAGYRRLGVPVHVFPVGSQVAGDVAIHDVIAPRDAPPGAPAGTGRGPQSRLPRTAGRIAHPLSFRSGASAPGDLAHHPGRRRANPRAADRSGNLRWAAGG